MRAKIVMACLLAALAALPAAAEQPSRVSVRDYGALGDGTTDDTAAFQAALAAVAEKGGTVAVPVGSYLINTHLNVPPLVTLEGVWTIPTAWTQGRGSTLLAVEGEGSEEGPPFITLNANSTLKGLTIFYPHQRPDAIQPYPWCVAGGGGDNSSVVDCLLVNPYQAVDFGSRPSGRHYIRNLYGQPLRRGIFVDKCFDIGRIENVHFWPFWNWDEKTGIREWLWANGESFIFGRTDWEYVLNTFSFGYKIGYRFIQTKDGAMNGNLLGLGADATNIAVLVEATQVPGLLFTNGQFVSFAGPDPTEVVVTKEHAGVVQFVNCSYWGPAHQIARIAGTGTVSFNTCNFVEWDREGKRVPAITLFGGHLLVNGCNFVRESPQLALRAAAQSAIVVANRMAGPLAIANPARAKLQVGLNLSQEPPTRSQEAGIVVDDNDPGPVLSFRGDWEYVRGGGNYYLGAHWAEPGRGEATAAFRPRLPRAGRYAVYAFLGPDPNRDHATNAPITIATAEGPRTIRVNLHHTRGEWVKLGTFRFAAGQAAISFSNAADGNVLADAVKLVPAAGGR